MSITRHGSRDRGLDAATNDRPTGNAAHSMCATGNNPRGGGRSADMTHRIAALTGRGRTRPVARPAPQAAELRSEDSPRPGAVGVPAKGGHLAHGWSARGGPQCPAIARDEAQTQRCRIGGVGMLRSAEMRPGHGRQSAGGARAVLAAHMAERLLVSSDRKTVWSVRGGTGSGTTRGSPGHCFARAMRPTVNVTRVGNGRTKSRRQVEPARRSPRPRGRGVGAVNRPNLARRRCCTARSQEGRDRVRRSDCGKSANSAR